jgi:hypothetical protein
MSKPTHRSAITNGSRALVGVDGRGTWARRFRDILSAHLVDLGGEACCTEAVKAIARRAATLGVELEMLEARFATAGSATALDLDLYARIAGAQRRLLEALGLQRRMRDVTPDLTNYIRTDR